MFFQLILSECNSREVTGSALKCVSMSEVNRSIRMQNILTTELCEDWTRTFGGMTGSAVKCVSMSEVNRCVTIYVHGKRSEML